MCAVDENLCQARMATVIAVEGDIIEIRGDMKAIIDITKKQDDIIKGQTIRIALMEQQLALLRWVSGVVIVAIIGLLATNLWKFFTG